MRKCLTIRLSENIYHKSQKFAFKKHLSLNRMINKSLEEYLSKEIENESMIKTNKKTKQ